MTRSGYDKLKAEVEQLETVEMPQVAARVAAVRSEGDLSENAEYHGARESQGMLQAKINLLRDKLLCAVIVERAKEAGDEVVFGATIRVKDLKFGDEEEYVLVGAGEEDFDSGRINVASPLAQGFLGHKVGDTVAIDVPAGTLRYEILEVRFD